MSESLDDQVERLAQFILEHVPGEPSTSDGAIDTALRILARHYGPDAQPSPLRLDRPISEDEAARIAEAVAKASANPGRTILVDDPWRGFPLEGDEVER